MASTYSPLKLELMTTGENNTTWGDKTNVNLGAIEALIGGSVGVTFASADVVMSYTDTSGPQSFRNMQLLLVGTTGGAPRNLIVPTVRKMYNVYNGCADTVTIKNATGGGVAIAPGKVVLVFNDGVNVAHTFSQTGNLTVSNVFNSASGLSYAQLNVAQTFTAQQTFAGTLTNLSQKLVNASELALITPTPAGGVINYDVCSQSVCLSYVAATSNWTMNFRGSASASLASLVNPVGGECVTVVYIATNGATPFFNNVIQVDGAPVLVKWQGGTAPTGNANSLDVYTYTLIKVNTPDFWVLASCTKFA